MEQILQRNPDINGVYAQNDHHALGAIQAIRAAGKTPGTDIKIVAIDGTQQAVRAVADGVLVADVETNPRFGPLAFESLRKFYSDAGVPTTVIISDHHFTKDNAATALNNGDVSLNPPGVGPTEGSPVGGEPVLLLDGVSKRFPGCTRCARSASSCGPASARVGRRERAGKSTLIKVATGSTRPTPASCGTGASRWPTAARSRRSGPASPRSTRRSTSSDDERGRNLFLNREPRRFGLIDGARMRRELREILRDYGVEVNVPSRCARSGWARSRWWPSPGRCRSRPGSW